MKEEAARLEAEIAALLGEAERTDAAEDLQYGADERGDELPKELAFREGRLAKMKQAMKALEAHAQAETQPEGAAVAEEGGEQPPAVPKDTAQRNFTDPESRIMRTADKAFIQGYNGQAAVDDGYQVIVAAQATNQAADGPQMPAMVEQIEENPGEKPQEMSLDAGYYSEGNVQYLEAEQIDPYLPPCRLKHREYREAKPEPVTENSTTRERTKAKVLTAEGRQKYGLRKQTVEPVFGQIKRCLGFDRFSLRGEHACNHEWRFVCAAHNLLKLFRYGAAAMAARAKAGMKSGEKHAAYAAAA